MVCRSCDGSVVVGLTTTTMRFTPVDGLRRCSESAVKSLHTNQHATRACVSDAHSNLERTSDRTSQEYGMPARILPAAGRDLVAWIWRRSAPTTWRTRFAPSSSPPLPRDRYPRGALRRRDRPRGSRWRRPVRLDRNDDAAHGRGPAAGRSAARGQPVPRSHAAGSHARALGGHRSAGSTLSRRIDPMAPDRGICDPGADIGPFADRHAVLRRLRRWG